jgi:serine/threonine-protein kinase
MVAVISGPHQGELFEFSQHETLLVGRASIAQLRLNKDRYVSRHHVRLEINPPECYVHDLSSRTGTFVNGEQIRGVFLQNRDIVTCGHTRLRFSVLEDPHCASSAETVIGEVDIPQGADVAESPPEGAQLRGPDGGILQTIPGYELLSEIGAGNMGVVYRARRKSTSQDVALKVVVPERATSAESMQLFVREASLLSQLDHPRIVRLFEFGAPAGQLFLAMELVEAEKTPKILNQQSDEARIRMSCTIICHVLEALSYAHSRSLVHRDVKPANILVSTAGGKLIVKLADFGLAKNYANAGFSGITAEGEARGTLSFMPPEQIVNCRYAKPCCDIYSTAATLYRYLSDEPLYKFSDESSALAMILDDEPRSLGQLCPHLPEELIAIVHRGLAKNPADRFVSAREMRRELLPFARRSSE